MVYKHKDRQEPAAEQDQGAWCTVSGAPWRGGDSSRRGRQGCGRSCICCWLDLAGCPQLRADVRQRTTEVWPDPGQSCLKTMICSHSLQSGFIVGSVCFVSLGVVLVSSAVPPTVDTC